MTRTELRRSDLLIRVDRTKCIGSGSCVMWADQTFDIDDQGLVMLLEESGDTAGSIRDAADNCPLLAITVTETGV